MSPLGPLLEELDRWRAAGREATFWWRDDDARSDTPALRQLLATAGRRGIPLALAAIPRGAETSLAAAVEERAGVTILQHGWSHENHAPPGAKKQELGPHRPPGEILAELERGRTALTRMFGDRFLPVLVPPHNRIAGGLSPRLPGAGFRGLSVHGARRQHEPVPGLVVSNVHVDLIDWRGTRGFVGAEAVVGQFTAHLSARREGRADADEPTGLMTHHLDHDAGCREFLEQALPMLVRHPAAHWLAAREVFRPA